MTSLCAYASCAVLSTFKTILRLLKYSQPYQENRLKDVTEPFIRHRTLFESEIQGKDVLIIGDVHGCLDEMLSLLEIAKQRTNKNLVTILVGDMVNKGPKNIEMLDYLMENESFYCVRGNHDQKVLQQYFDKIEGKLEDGKCISWLHNLTQKHIVYLKSLPYTIYIPCLDVIVVHAGLIPGIDLHLQPATSMLTMRSIVHQDDWFHGHVLSGSSQKLPYSLWGPLWKGPCHVYFGHDAAQGLQLHPHSTGLDTGCVYGGKLTAMLLHLTDSPTLKINCFKREVIDYKSGNVYRPVSKSGK